MALPSASSSSSSSSGDPAPVVKAAGPPPAAAKAGPPPGPPGNNAKANERVLEVWDGRFPFVTIQQKGVHTGYGVTCGKHVNANGKHALTQCKKSLTIGTSGISQEEAALRLKRWLVAGAFGRPLDPECERQSHIALGGTHCTEFRSGSTVGWSQLDADIDVLIHTLYR